MAHFAQINNDNTVIQVIVAERDVISTGLFGNQANWIQTSYNTYAGMHIHGGTPFRKNYAGVGFKYDNQRDAFIPPQPYPSWLLDDNTCLWQPPVSRPDDGQQYIWDESTQSWVLIEG